MQTFYDFGRNHATTALEGFYNDNWGNTFFFIDLDYNFRNANNAVVSPSGAYYEIARCFNFWKDSKLGALSLQLEYNGGLGIFGSNADFAVDNHTTPQSWTVNPNQYHIGGFPVNNAYLAGVDHFIHNADFSNTLNLKFLYKYFMDMSDYLPFQFTAVWGMKDLFGVKGINFSGFLDIWSENSLGANTMVVLSEPQLWYNVGQHFGCDNLNVGTEVEFAYNFAGTEGFKVRPCLGFKWVF